MTSTPLSRAITAYRQLDLTKSPPSRPPRPERRRCLRLTETQLARLVSAYQAGATVYELAAEFGIDRRTVSDHLKRQGVSLRRRPPTTEMIDEMIGLYDSGLSLAKVGATIGVNATTVLRCWRDRSVQTRETQGRH